MKRRSAGCDWIEDISCQAFFKVGKLALMFARYDEKLTLQGDENLTGSTLGELHFFTRFCSYYHRGGPRLRKQQLKCQAPAEQRWRRERSSRVHALGAQAGKQMYGSDDDDRPKQEVQDRSGKQDVCRH